MNFSSSRLPGVVKVSLDRAADERGWFQRTFCAQTFREHALPDTWRQSSLCYNAREGTLRGLHWQAAPHEEIKLVSVLHGRVFDVLVDLRPESPTFRQFETFVLDGTTPQALLLPGRVAHGYLTLTDGALLEYHMTEDYFPDAARILRYDDPRLAIPWPRSVECISARDRNASVLDELQLR